MVENYPGLKAFCRNVYRLRKEHGLSQKEMARIMGVGVGSLRKVERGTVPPRMDILVLHNLTLHFSIPISSLFWAEDHKQDFTMP